MYYLLASIASMLISFMIFVNGYVNHYFNLYLAVVLIHVVGLVATALYLIVTRNPFKIKKKVSFYYYLGGATGYLLTLFNVVAFGKIPLSAIVALALLGQVVTALLIDNYGLFKMPINKFNKNNALGVSIISIGIIVMLLGTDIVIIPILFAFFSGITIVITRQLNAGLTQYSNPYTSSIYNFLVGLIISLFVLVIIQLIKPTNLVLDQFTFNKSWIFLGGLLGLIINILLNYSVPKIAAFNMTLIIFSGQILMGLIIDYFSYGTFSWQNFIGALFALIGLYVNMRKKKS